MATIGGGYSELVEDGVSGSWSVGNTTPRTLTVTAPTTGNPDDVFAYQCNMSVSWGTSGTNVAVGMNVSSSYGGALGVGTTTTAAGSGSVGNFFILKQGESISAQFYNNGAGRPMSGSISYKRYKLTKYSF